MAFKKWKDDIYRRPGSPKLYWRGYSKKTGEVFRSLGETHLNAAARAKLEHLRAEFYRHDKTKQSLKYRDVAYRCFQVEMVGNRESTKDEARRIYSLLVEALGEVSVDQVTDELWVEQVEQWKADSDRTCFSHVRVYAKQIDRYAFNRGYKTTLCSFPVDDPAPREGRRLSDKQFQKLLEACERLYRERERVAMRLFLVLGRHTGMRKSEILELTWDRVDLDKGIITLRPQDVKTGGRLGRNKKRRNKGRQFPIPDVVTHELQSVRVWREAQASKKHGLISKRMRCSWVFPNRAYDGPQDNFKTALERIREISGVEFVPHDLRHTFITSKIHDEGVSPLIVGQYCGVSLKVIQDRYLHTRPDDLMGVIQTKSDIA